MSLCLKHAIITAKILTKGRTRAKVRTSFYKKQTKAPKNLNNLTLTLRTLAYSRYRHGTSNLSCIRNSRTFYSYYFVGGIDAPPNLVYFVNKLRVERAYDQYLCAE